MTDRREFLKSLLAGSASVALVLPTIAGAQRKISWGYHVWKDAPEMGGMWNHFMEWKDEIEVHYFQMRTNSKELTPKENQQLEDGFNKYLKEQGIG